MLKGFQLKVVGRNDQQTTDSGSTLMEQLSYHTKQWGEQKDIKLAFYNFVEHKLSPTHWLVDLAARAAISYIAKMH